MTRDSLRDKTLAFAERVFFSPKVDAAILVFLWLATAAVAVRLLIPFIQLLLKG
jgi:hypothetical protein